MGIVWLVPKWRLNQKDVRGGSLVGTDDCTEDCTQEIYSERMIARLVCEWIDDWRDMLIDERVISGCAVW